MKVGTLLSMEAAKYVGRPGSQASRRTGRQASRLVSSGQVM